MGNGAARQFGHPLVVGAKLGEIAAACHAHVKTPWHWVVIELDDGAARAAAARNASRELGLTRM